MSDDLDTAKLRDLLVKATPGPWRFRHRCVGNEGDPSPGHDEQIGLGWDWSDDNANIPPEPMRGVFALGADAALVMAARNELPALLDRIEALGRVIDDALCHLEAGEPAEAAVILQTRRHRAREARDDR